MLIDQIQSLIQAALAAAQADDTLPNFDAPAVEISRPKQAEHGDFATNVALVAAAALRKSTGNKVNPRQIAQAVADHVPTDGLISSVEIAGPGFINLRLAQRFVAEEIEKILDQGDDYGRSDLGAGQRALVEYVSANPTGPLTVGHGRNAVLGDTIANLLDWLGYEVTREYYFNNAGRQMRVLGQSVRARYEELLADEEMVAQLNVGDEERARLQQHRDSFSTKTLDLGGGESLTVPASFPDDGYQGEYIFDVARGLIEEHGASLLEAESVQPFQEAAVDTILADIYHTMGRLGVQMDSSFNEHSLYENEKIWEVLHDLRERGHVFDADGAVWFRTSELGKDKDEVLVKSSGEPTYRLPDIAYHVDKFERGFDKIVDVFGADHIAEYPDIVKATELLGFDAGKIEVLIYQFVTLVRGGKPVKMSTRRANFVTLDELLDEVGEDVTRFFFLMRSPNSHLEFNLDLAQETSEKNPVFYLQYAHARVCSIMRKAEARGVEFAEEPDLLLLDQPGEVALMKGLLDFPAIIRNTAQSKEPQTLVTYLGDVATAFNGFYRDSRILGEAQAIASARMGLARAARIVLANGLHILGISAPEEMRSESEEETEEEVVEVPA